METSGKLWVVAILAVSSCHEALSQLCSNDLDCRDDLYEDIFCCKGVCCDDPFESDFAEWIEDNLAIFISICVAIFILVFIVPCICCCCFCPILCCANRKRKGKVYQPYSPPDQPAQHPQHMPGPDVNQVYSVYIPGQTDQQQQQQQPQPYTTPPSYMPPSYQGDFSNLPPPDHSKKESQEASKSGFGYTNITTYNPSDYSQAYGGMKSKE